MTDDSTPKPTFSSMDDCLQWLTDQRKSDPDAPLSRLLGSEHKLPQSFLLDIACVDLLNRRRSGQDVIAREYADDLPQLAEPDNFLDLIDSEICVDRELGQQSDTQTYLDRYPEYANEVKELLSISSGGRDALVTPADHPNEIQAERSLSIVMDDSERSLDFSIIGNEEPSTAGTQPFEPPIVLPDWFSGKQCVASGQGHWLLRGRDAARGETLALKVIRLPAQITESEVDGLLDACEKCANVSNPSWTVPIIAAVQQKHFAVIRPWVFGSAWEQLSRKPDPPSRTKQLATIAYSLQAAHRVGAAHGAVSAANILVDHGGLPKLMDCCSSFNGIHRCLGNSLNGDFSWVDRQLLDVQDLIRLIVHESIQWPRVWADHLIPELRTVADLHRDEACGMIGDKLMRWADERFTDTPRESTKKWRSKLAGWIDGTNR